MIAFPNAKINIGLNVIEKRPDGFHNIESIFFPILDVKDILEIVENFDSSDVVFSSSGITIPGNKNENLCLKAYHLIKNDFDIPPVKIHLHKIIPIGAGLGGGSSDAAFTLKILNQLFHLEISQKKLLEYARQLGSDCAFFIANKPIYAFNKGDEFYDVELNLNNYKILVDYPSIHISTADAYAGITPKKPRYSILELIKNPIESWKNNIFNDFEKSILKKYPEIEESKIKMYQNGAIYASMTGSGSAVFGIFDNKSNPKD